MGKAIENPLYGIQVGSIFTESGKHGATVLNPGLTDFNHQEYATGSMSGTSQYVYSDQMNQGSFTAAGGYGISGLAKVSAAVGGYLGNTTAKSGDSLSININVIKWAGIEYIKFNDLTVAQLLAGLQNNARDGAMRALEAFVELQKAEIEAKAKDDNPSKEKKEQLQAEWVRASLSFYQSFGAGLVVGVLWGGWGTVKLDFTKCSKESKWEGGGNASFSYAGPAAALDLAATFGHTEDTIGHSAKAKLDYFVNGTCVQAAIEGWYNDLLKKATGSLSDLGKEPVSRAAAMSGAVKPPKIPEFNKPEPEKKITDLIGNIKSLEGLHAYAQAAAFEKQKAKPGGTSDLGDFLKSAGKANDVSAIPTGAVSPEVDRIVLDRDFIPKDLDAGPSEMLAGAAEGNEKPDEPKQEPNAPDMSAYEPMGIWSIPWGQLLPWLVSGQDNRIPENAPFLSMIALKTLHQDFLSLSRLYDRIRASGATLTVKGVPVDFKGISDTFSRGAAVSDNFLTQLSTGPVDPATVNSKIADLINHLREDANTIYRTWAAVGGLRKCELGAGLMFRGPYTFDKAMTVTRIWAPQGQVVVDYTAFTRQKRNFEVFSQSVKGWPFVLPDGRIGVFMCDGKQETSGFLSALSQQPLGVIVRRRDTAIGYEEEAGPRLPADQNLLTFRRLDRHPGNPDILYRKCSSLQHESGNKTDVLVIPLPFSAAEGITDWKGSALTTGMGELPGVLQDLRKELAKLKSWSFDSDWWGDRDWKNFRYSMQMPVFYLGLVDEPGNVFRESAADPPAAAFRA